MSEKENLKKDLIENYKKGILMQYSTQKNLSFIEDILDIFLDYEPFFLKNFFDFRNSSGLDLTKIAYTLFGINRNFEGIELTDEELITICFFVIAKKGIKRLSVSNINEIFKNIFDNEVIIKIVPEEIIYIVKKDFAEGDLFQALLKFELFLKPTTCKKATIVKVEEGVKYLHFPNENYIFYNSKQGTFQDEENPLENVKWLSEDDVIIL